MAAITVPDLENAKLDVDHIADIATSSELTATDRLGHEKETIAGLSLRFPESYSNAAAAAASASSASASASSASSSASSANAAKVAAEAARDSVNTTGKVFDTPAAGIAGTTNGQTFSVVDASQQFWIVYKNNAGVAQEVSRSYTKAYLDALIRQDGDAKRWTRWSDEYGYSFAQLDADGMHGGGNGYWTVNGYKLDTNTFILQQEAALAPVLRIMDEYHYGVVLDGVELNRLSQAVQPTKIDLAPFTIQASSAANSFAVTDGFGYYRVRVPAEGATGDTSQLLNDVAALKVQVAASTTSGGGYAGVPTPRLKTVAHRGNTISGTVPENSLDALYFSSRAGYKYCETDIQKTSDAKYVIMHDNTVDRTCRNASDYSAVTSAIDIATMTLATIQANYVLAAADIRQRRPPPSLDQYCATCRDVGLHPVLELKDWRLTNADITAIFNIARSYLGEDGFTFTSFNIPMLDFARSLSTKTNLWYIYDPASALTNAALDNVKAHAPASAYPAYASWTPALVAYAQQINVPVGAWTVPNAQFDTLVKLGVKEFATDTLGPPLTDQRVIYRSYSDLTFADFTKTGTLTNGVMALSQGQTMTFSKGSATAVDFGAFFLSLDLKGAATIAATNLAVSPSNATADWVSAVYQGLMKATNFSLTITGGTGGCSIKDLRLAIASF